MLPCPQEKPTRAALPQEKPTRATLPQEWQDDERMAFLFSAFKQNREVNCSDWDSKMAFWLPLVVNQSRRKGQLRFTLKELQENFQRKGSTPLGLGTVIEELVRQKKLQRESEFVANINSGWISWGMGLFLVKPLKWTLSAMLGWNKIPASEVYVVTELLKEKADSAYCLFQNSFPSSQSMVSVSELHSLCASLCPDERMFYLVLLQLQKEKRITVLERNGEKIVKFAQGAEDAVSPVNDVDLGVYQLKQSEKLLHEKVEMLSVQAERSKAEAQSAYRAGKKQLALRSLKSKKRLDKRIGELQSKLECVQSILDRIASSQTDRMVVDAYQAGVGALKLAMKDITVQKAEDLMEQIQEFCDVQDDVSQTLAGADFSGLDVDTEELENELDSLLRDSTNKPSGRRRSSHLSFISDLPDMDTEKLENELDSLLRDSTNKPSGLPDVPQTELLPSAIAQGAQRKPSLTREGLMMRPGSILSEPRQVRKPVVE